MSDIRQSESHRYSASKCNGVAYDHRHDVAPISATYGLKSQRLSDFQIVGAARKKHHPKLPLKRVIREIRRRTQVVGTFPDGHSALMLVATWPRHVAATKQGERRYLVMEALLNPATQVAAA